MSDNTASSDAYTDHYERAHRSQASTGATPGAVAAGHGGASGPAQVINARQVTNAPRPRGRGMLIGAAAAVLLLLGGLLVLAPDNTPSAVATVRSAAAAAADADTGRIETVFSASGTDGVEDGSVEGAFQAAYSGNDISFTLDVEGIDAAEELEDLPVSEVRLVDGIVYVNDGSQWFAVDTDGLLGQMVTDFVDPRSVLETVQEITETTEIGQATIDGVETTRYQSVIDLADETLSQSGWLGFEGAGIDAEGEIVVDLYVDDSGLLRQFDISGDLQGAENATESGTFMVTTRFFDIGSAIAIEAPADVEVFDPLQQLFDN